jgi:hypothetical protein
MANSKTINANWYHRILVYVDHETLLFTHFLWWWLSLFSGSTYKWSYITAWLVNSSNNYIKPFFLNLTYFPKSFGLSTSIAKAISFLIYKIVVVSTLNSSTINSIGSIYYYNNIIIQV